MLHNLIIIKSQPVTKTILSLCNMTFNCLQSMNLTLYVGLELHSILGQYSTAFLVNFYLLNFIGILSLQFQSQGTQVWHQTLCAIWKSLLVLEVIQLNFHLAGILTAKGHICVNHFSTVAVVAMKTILKPKLFASKSAPMQVISFYSFQFFSF